MAAPTDRARSPLSSSAGSPWAGATAGMLAAAAALATAEMLSALIADVPSLVIAVAEVFVDETPSGVVEWSIETLGAAQQTLLVWGVVVVSLAVGAVLGVVAMRRFPAAAAGFGLFGLIGIWAAERDPGTSLLAAVVVSFAAVLVGAGVLRAFGAGASGVPGDRAGEEAAPAGRPDLLVDRRRFVAVAASAAAWAAVGLFVSRSARNEETIENAREELADRLETADISTFVVDDNTLDEIAGIPPYLTPNDDFYLIDTALRPPLVDPDDWSMRIHGMVDEELVLSLDDLLDMEQTEAIITLSCVSNEVGGDLVDNAHWSGVRLDTLLRRAGVADAADQVVGRSVDGWTGGFPTAVALDGRPALVALTMNGAPLPIEHGFPARLVVPGLYGYVSATKWLSEIELTTWEAFDGYWIERGWAKRGPVRTQSRIDVPRSGETMPAGDVVVAGVAWAPHRGITAVEVSIDDGPWRTATLNDQLTDNAWRQWVLRAEVGPGDHIATVRATDGTGEVQTAERRSPIPSGATGRHRRRFTAT